MPTKSTLGGRHSSTEIVQVYALHPKIVKVARLSIIQVAWIKFRQPLPFSPAAPVNMAI